MILVFNYKGLEWTSEEESRFCHRLTDFDQDIEEAYEDFGTFIQPPRTGEYGDTATPRISRPRILPLEPTRADSIRSALQSPAAS